MDYGINNRVGLVPVEEVRRILRISRDLGIDLIDTAAAYGTAESVIGELLAQDESGFKLVTKIAPLAAEPAEVLESFYRSTSQLGTETLYGLLVHDFPRFTAKRENWDVLRGLRTGGRVRKIGFSVYYPRQVDWLIEREFDFDIVQLPYNVLDQRFADFLPLLKARGVEVHVRSVFLQGLFFVPENELESHFIPVAGKLKRLKALAQANDVPLAALPLSFALSAPEVAKVVIGVDDARGLREDIDTLRHFERLQAVLPQLEALAESDESILLPFNWPSNSGRSCVQPSLRR